MSAMVDGCDIEVNSHIQLFLDRLAPSLRLERVFELTLKDPKRALEVLLDVRRAVEAEQRKAQAIFQLSQIQLQSNSEPIHTACPMSEPSLLM